MLPTLNEAATVADVIGRIPTDIPGVGSVRVVVVDDGSTDDTAVVAAEAGAEVVRLGRHRGLGAVFRRGLQAALAMGADVIVNIDADGQFDPRDIPKLVGPILDRRADMVTASRFADPAMVPDMPWIRKWGNRRFARLISRLTAEKLHDVSCGFRAYSRDAALRATLIGVHTYTHEVILDLAFRGFQILEVPVKVEGSRRVGTSRVAGDLWHYGWRSLLIILRAYRDYRPMSVFGALSAVLLLVTLLTGSFVVVHYARTGGFFPYRFVAFTAAAFGFASLICYVTGLLAGMIDRLRILQEEQLFLQRKREYATPRRGEEP